VLGIVEPLPREIWDTGADHSSDEVEAKLRAALAAIRIRAIEELAQVTGCSIREVRSGLRRLAARGEGLALAELAPYGAH
jgi:hypothetical protein